MIRMEFALSVWAIINSRLWLDEPTVMNRSSSVERSGSGAACSNDPQRPWQLPQRLFCVSQDSQKLCLDPIRTEESRRHNTLPSCDDFIVGHASQLGLWVVDGRGRGLQLRGRLFETATAIPATNGRRWVAMDKEGVVQYLIGDVLGDGRPGVQGSPDPAATPAEPSESAQHLEGR